MVGGIYEGDMGVEEEAGETLLGYLEKGSHICPLLSICHTFTRYLVIFNLY